MYKTRAIPHALAALCGLMLLVSACNGIMPMESAAAQTPSQTPSPTVTPTPTPRGAVIPTRAPTPTITPSPTATDTPSVSCLVDRTSGEWISYGDEVTGEIINETDRTAFCFNGNAGDWISLSASTTSGSLDTYLALFSLGENVLIAWNDDADPSTYNSRLTDVYLPYHGQYAVLVSAYRGEGTFRLTLNIDDPPFPNLHGTALPLIPNDSGSVLSNGEIMPQGFIAGDIISGESPDIMVQAFFSYSLSPIPDGTNLSYASLIVTNCMVVGDPFGYLGQAIIEWLPYGTLDTNDYGQRALGAIIMARLNGCPEAPIDVQRPVQLALDREYDRWQLRMEFTAREPRANGRTDALALGSWPVLLVDY